MQIKNTFLLFILSLFLLSTTPTHAINAYKNALQYHAIGDPIDIKGHLRILVEDSANQSSLRYFINNENTSSLPIEVKFDKKPSTLASGQIMTVHGIVSEEKPSLNRFVKVSDFNNLSNIHSKQASAAPTVRNMAAFIVDLNDASASQNYSNTVIANNMNASKLAYAAASYGKMNFNLDANRDGKIDIFGPFKINYSRAECDPWSWSIAADAMAQAAGINLSLYQNIIYILPPKRLLTCTWFELADLGSVDAVQTRLWTVGADQPGTYFHGLAHNFGLWHSSLDPEDDGIIKYEYADASDVMGPGPMGLFNGPHAAQLNWFEPNGVQTVTRGGTYTLYPMSADPTQKQPQVLKIIKPGTDFAYFLSYRQPEGADKGIPAEFTTGVNIHTQKIKMDSGYDLHSLYVKTLSDGQYYPFQNLRFTQLPRNGDNSNVKVQIAFNACNKIPPTLSISPVLAAVQPNKAAFFNIKIKNNDMGTCSSSYFRLSQILPVGLIGRVYPSFIQLDMGKEQSARLYTNSTVMGGDFTVTVNAKDVLPPDNHNATAANRIIVNSSGILNMQPGTTYKIYDGDWTMMPDFSKLKPTSSGVIKNFDISGRGTSKYYAYEFDGYIYIVQPGTYRFYTASDDGSMLYINDSLVVNNDGLHQRRERGGYMTMSQGWNRIRVDYFQRTGAANLSVYYSGPGVDKMLIPDTVLSYVVP